MRPSVPMGGRLLNTIGHFKNLHALIIGDAMLDGYLEGYADRLCREAPVPVVTVQRTKLASGGAANAAANIADLGAEAHLLSVIGDDNDGNTLRHLLKQQRVDVEPLLVQPGRHTLAKRRIISTDQMIVRYDEGTTDPIDAATEEQVIARLQALWGHCNAIIVSDYGYGVLTHQIIRAIGDLQRDMPRILVVDSKNLATYREVGVTAVKPNYGEAARLLSLPNLAGACARADQITGLGDQVLAMTGAQIVAVTLDSEGAVIFEHGSAPYRTFADPKPDSRAAGAGDTFIGALALALAAYTDTPRAAEIASAAATVVVNKEGTTTCSAEELWEYLAAEDKYFGDARQLAQQIEISRQHCRRIVFTNGCFDILHRGHIAYLNRAKTLGDILVVAVNSDDSVRRLKGPNRPINSLHDRVSVLSALSCVDHIVSFDKNTPEDLLRLLKPDVFVKGGDYTRETLPEAHVVEEQGGKVEILPYMEDQSTTNIIQRIRESYADMPLSG